MGFAAFPSLSVPYAARLLFQVLAQECLPLSEQVGLAGRGGQPVALLRRGHCLIGLTAFGVGSGQRVPTRMVCFPAACSRTRQGCCLSLQKKKPLLRAAS